MIAQRTSGRLDAPELELPSGPVYATASKARALSARGLELVRAVRALTSLPLVAIGSITPDTAPEAIAAGADSVATIRALTHAQDTAAAVRAFVARLA
jgi:thiamine-phosphate pyrophosphorylase